MNTPSRPSRLIAALLATLAMGALSGTFAQALTLQSGDIVTPGNGNGGGTIWRLRNNASTPVFASNLFAYPGDMIIDKQGRLVFMASPSSRNANDAALFRIDPTSGGVERLFYLPYIAQAGDTLPEGASGAAGFYGQAQSLHLERSYSMTIDDDVNGGIPQVHAEDAYGFAIMTSLGGQTRPMAYRYLPGARRCEVGTDISIMPQNYVAMASEGMDIWYGCYGMVAHALPDITIKTHFHVGNTTVDASLKVSPLNKLVYNNPILDNTVDPNVTIQCGNVTDSDVPMVNGGFNPLGVGTLGLLGGSLYNTSNSVSTGVPYMFNLSPRNPFLNPYICLYYTAVTHNGRVPFWTDSGLATSPSYTSPDGGQLLAKTGSGLLSINPSGQVTLLDNLAPLTGRPLRWTGGSVPAQLASASATTSTPDTTASALVLRVDSLANVLVTDSKGKRVGWDAAGNVVNDFAEAGLATSLGGPTGPKVIAIYNPAPGNFYATIVGTGAGTYKLTGYLANTGTGGTLASVTGTATNGSLQHRALTFSAPLALSWLPGDVGVGPGIAPAAGFGFVTVGPVPSSAAVRFACRVPEAGDVSLEIFDPAGRRVREVSNGAREPGMFQVAWDGAAEDGRRVAPGVYLARLAMAGRSAVRRVTITR